MEAHMEVARVAVMIVENFAANLRLAETIRYVSLPDQVCIILHNLGTEAPAESERRRLNKQPAPQQPATKVLVAVKSDSDQPMPRPAADFIFDQLLAAFRIPGSCVTDLGIEVAFALQHVAKIAPPFEQQILIHSPFGINGKQLPQ